MKELHIYGTPEQCAGFLEDEHAAELLGRVDSMHVCFRHEEAKKPSAADAFDGMEKAIENFPTAEAPEEYTPMTSAKGYGAGAPRTDEQGAVIIQWDEPPIQHPNKGKSKPKQMKKCVVCGKEFMGVGCSKLCSEECKAKRKQTNRERLKTVGKLASREDEIAPRPEPSKAFEKEAKARAEGKRYADLQKADTISKYARVEK